MSRGPYKCYDFDPNVLVPKGGDRLGMLPTSIFIHFAFIHSVDHTGLHFEYMSSYLCSFIKKCSASQN